VSVMTVAVTRSDWITLAEAMRITGLTRDSLKSAALAGSLRFSSILGMRVLYSRSDCERIGRQLTASASA
jgi:hypothetical protein